MEEKIKKSLGVKKSEWKEKVIDYKEEKLTQEQIAENERWREQWYRENLFQYDSNGNAFTQSGEFHGNIYNSSATEPYYPSTSSDYMKYDEEDTYKEKVPQFGWKGREVKHNLDGIAALMQDGDQQLFNPYGHETGKWTMYSFRPIDTTGDPADRGLEKWDENYPVISITPSSFQAIESIDDMLNAIPYVVVREYFFKNQASQMVGILT